MSRTGWRLATAADIDAVVRTLGAGFATDPVWGLWGFPDEPDRAAKPELHWTTFVRAGLKYDGVIMTPGGEAVAVWIPPGVPELDEDDEAALGESTNALFGSRAPLLFEVYERFAEAAPKVPEHWTLSLLATHPDHRGGGLGMALVEDFLETVDARHEAAYLESTNPANLPRYERAGYQRYGSFEVPEGPTVTTMWRPAR